MGRALVASADQEDWQPHHLRELPGLLDAIVVTGDWDHLNRMFDRFGIDTAALRQRPEVLDELAGGGHPPPVHQRMYVDGRLAEPRRRRQLAIVDLLRHGRTGQTHIDGGAATR